MGERRRALMVAFIAFALAGAGCETAGSSGPTNTPTTSASTSASPAPVVKLTGLKIEQPHRWTADSKTWRVTVSWDEPVGFAVDHYQVRRNGITIAEDSQIASLEDGGVYPAATFDYRVVAVDAEGLETIPATAKVKTGEPPVDDARLQGRFFAKLHITSQSNLQSGASGGGAIIFFDPTCKNGPCDTKITFNHESAKLAGHHGSYSGTILTSFLLDSCTGATISETLVFDLRVTKGVARAGTWRAAKIEGSLDETATAPGCLTGRIAYRVTAILRR